MSIKYATTGVAMFWNASTWGKIVTGASWNTSTKTLAPASSPGWTINALAGLYVEIRTTTVVLCTILSNTADVLITNESGPATGTARYVLFNEVKPAANDSASLNGAVVVMNETPIPASGSLTALYSQDTAASPANNTGQLTVALDVLGDAVINVTGGAITGGTLNTGFVRTSGAAATKTLTVNCENMTGGSAANCAALAHNSTGAVVVNGNVVGGTVSNDAMGVSLLSGCGNLTVNGSCTGNSGPGINAANAATTGTTTVNNGSIVGGSLAGYYMAPGIRTPQGVLAGVVFNNVNLINGTASVAYTGVPPTWNITNNANYVQWKVGGATNTKFGPEPTAAQLKSGVVCGDVTGTLQTNFAFIG